MDRENAEKIITEYLKPVFGFALKRCKSLHDAEDLSQEIMLKAFRALLLHGDIEDSGKFIWAVAHNALANYYRDASRNAVGISPEETADPEDPADLFSDADDAQTLKRLQSEIAYLAKVQRRIVIAHYYENKKLADLAEELGVPLGTVKWHLFEAKKELKRGMEKMRNSNELKFNPVQFRYIGLNGSASAASREFLRTTLSQNICYDVRNEAKTVAQIADDLGVSPVYIENEVNDLEEYGLLSEKKGKYLVNFLINEPTSDFLTLQDEMYKKAADIFANELFDALTAGGIIEDPGILCRQTDEEITMHRDARRGDRNFILWSLIPYIAACSGRKMADEKISFEEVAAIRPDGSHNFYYATVFPDQMVLPEDYVYMENWCGPMRTGSEGNVLWQIQTQWSDRGASAGLMDPEADRVLSLFECEQEGGVLSKEDYAWLAERGLIKICRQGDHRKTSWQIVRLVNTEIRDRLIAIGDGIREKHKAELAALKAPYARAALETVPAHLRKLKEYELQFVFSCDGWFILHCITTLLKNGKLKLPTAPQRKPLTMLIYPQ